MTLGNRYRCTIFIDNDPIYSDWGRDMISLSTEEPCKNYYILLSLLYLHVICIIKTIILPAPQFS